VHEAQTLYHSINTVVNTLKTAAITAWNTVVVPTWNNVVQHVGSAIKGGGTALPQSVKGGGIALLGQNETCFQCHTAQRGPFVFEHRALREGCITCHSPHGSVNQRMLTERNQTLCLKCHFQEQKTDGRIFIGDSDHTNRLPQGTCWSAGCHEAPHGSQVNEHLRF